MTAPPGWIQRRGGAVVSRRPGGTGGEPPALAGATPRAASTIARGADSPGAPRRLSGAAGPGPLAGVVRPPCVGRAEPGDPGRPRVRVEVVADLPACVLRYPGLRPGEQGPLVNPGRLAGLVEHVPVCL